MLLHVLLHVMLCVCMVLCFSCLQLCVFIFWCNLHNMLYVMLCMDLCFSCLQLCVFMFWCKWHNMLHVNNIVMLCMDLCFLCLSLCVFMFWCKWKEEDSSGVSRQQKAISRPTYHTLAYLATTEYHYNICSSEISLQYLFFKIKYVCIIQ